jgi:hypothetical protein
MSANLSQEHTVSIFIVEEKSSKKSERSKWETGAVHSSETLMDLYQTTAHYSKDSTVAIATVYELNDGEVSV